MTLASVPFVDADPSASAQLALELRELGYQILAISPDRPEKLQASIDSKKGQELPGFVLLSDSSMTATRQFGIAYKVDDATFERLKEFGIDIEAASGHEHRILPVPAAFVVGTDGRIKYQYVNPDYKVRIDPAVLLAAARAER